MLSKPTNKGTILEAKVITRVVTYSRVSGDDSKTEGRNIHSQQEMNRQYALEKGYQVIAELAEDVTKLTSGADLDLPELNKALEMARNNEFDILIVREIDRLSRNLAKQLIVEEEFRRYGVVVEYVLETFEDTPEGRLNKHIKATIAEYEREKIKQRLTRGRRNSVKSGNILIQGRPPYGYVAKIIDAKRTLEIDPEEAAVVRLIFACYTIGDEMGKRLSISAIAEKLSGLGVLTPADKNEITSKKQSRGQWHESSVRQILKNETYAGIWYYRKKTVINGKQTRRPKKDWIPVEVPAIVNHDTWNAAQALLKENAKRSGHGRKYNYLLAGHIKCGKCNSRIYGAQVKSGKNYYRYYRCIGQQGRMVDVNCDVKAFKSDNVDKAIWEWLTETLADTDRLKAKLNEYQTQQDAAHTPLKERLSVVEILLSKKYAKRDRWLEMYADGIIDKDDLLEKKQHLDKTIADLEIEQQDLTTSLQSQTLSSTEIKTLVEFSEQLSKNIELMQDDFDEKRWYIERLNVQVFLQRVNDEVKAYASCILGKMSLQLTVTLFML